MILVSLGCVEYRVTRKYHDTSNDSCEVM